MKNVVIRKEIVKEIRKEIVKNCNWKR